MKCCPLKAKDITKFLQSSRKDQSLPWIGLPQLNQYLFKKTEGSVKRILRKEGNYHSVFIEKGKIKALTIAHPHPMLGKKIWVAQYFGPSELYQPNQIINHLENQKILIQLNVMASDESLLKRIEKEGQSRVGVFLFGEVQKSLRKLRKKTAVTLLENQKLEYRMLQKSEFKEIIDLEYKSHQSEPSSVVHRFKKKDFLGFKRNFMDMCKDKTALGLFHKNKRIGHIMLRIDPKFPSTANISTIALLPQYKGRGLGLDLYRAGLELLHSRKVKFYFGYSNTHGVLKIAKVLDRRPISYSYESRP